MIGKSPCLTPHARLWLRRRKRFIIGDEKMALQGVNMVKYRPFLDEFPEAFKSKLAGNSFSFHNFVIAFVAALSTLSIDWFS